MHNLLESSNLSELLIGFHQGRRYVLNTGRTRDRKYIYMRIYSRDGSDVKIRVSADVDSFANQRVKLRGCEYQLDIRGCEYQLDIRGCEYL